MEETLVFLDPGFLSKLSRYFGKGKYISYDIIELSKQDFDDASLEKKKNDKDNRK